MKRNGAGEAGAACGPGGDHVATEDETKERWTAEAKPSPLLERVNELPPITTARLNPRAGEHIDRRSTRSVADLRGCFPATFSIPPTKQPTKHTPLCFVAV